MKALPLPGHSEKNWNYYERELSPPLVFKMNVRQNVHNK